jgi:anti-sigma regulatory factor (Ser/Thr protein kinase)
VPFRGQLHGARFDPHQTIAVQLASEGHRLKVRVSDHGAGFDARTVPTPAPDRGRGLAILYQYASDHTFEDGGRTVAFELPLRPADEPKE